MSPRSRRCRLVLAAILAAVVVPLGAFADSHVRIVRLSSVEGQVQIDRGIGGGPERAILNTPIVEGTRLVTGNDGLAEVEFENESAIRLTNDSEIKFSQLLMNDAGAKVNQFEVTKGIVYLDTASKGDDVYRVKVGNASLLAHRDTLMRIDATPDQLKLAVFHGDVQLEGANPAVSIHKKETLTADLNDLSKDSVAKGAEPERFDGWNKEREDYTKTYAENAGYGGPSRGYGLQDLNYYGDFFYANGYGYAWQPFGFAGSMLNWDPYSNGAWLFYPGLGYSWASGYPWGWLPFHYGSWAFINGTGWAWLPGGGYHGAWYAGNFLTVPRITKAPSGWTAATPPPITTAESTPRSVLVGTPTKAITIPGGRVQPNFASLVPGRSLAATKPSAFVRPSNSVVQHGNSAHVFAAPVRTVSLTGPAIGGVRGGSATGPSAHMGVGSTATSHGSSGGGGHK